MAMSEIGCLLFAAQRLDSAIANEIIKQFKDCFSSELGSVS